MSRRVKLSVIIGDYEYFTTGHGSYSVQVVDKTKKEYGAILSEIDGVPVKDLSCCFAGCVNMVESPHIPRSAKIMIDTYNGCRSMRKPAILPPDVKVLTRCYSGCVSMEIPPDIPKSVIAMSGCFDGCNFEYDYKTERW